MPYSRTAISHLRVRVPAGPWPCWLGEALLGLDALPGVALQAVVDASAPAASPRGSVDRWWRARIPGLRDWRPDAGAAGRLAAWHAASSGHPDFTLRLDSSIATAPADPVAADDSTWRVCDAAGRGLWRAFPQLESITAGDGITLRCIAADGRELRLGIGTASRYGVGLALLPTALCRLVARALADRAFCDAASASNHAPPAMPLAAPTAPPSSHGGEAFAWRHGARGGWLAGRARLRSWWTAEHWRIGVIDAPIGTLVEPGPLPAVRWITAEAADNYCADPFGLPGDDRRLVCERYDEVTGIGRIELLTFDADDRLLAAQALPVGRDAHASFPSMVAIDGRRFGVAETVAAGECLLHEVDADGRWHALVPLLPGVSAADPTLFTWQGRHWLAYTDTARGAHDNLCLQHAERIEGPWTPHALNPVKIDVGSARSAGGWFVHRGALYRPAQDCRHTYGGAVVLHRVEALTPDSFAEVEVRRFEPDPHGRCPDGLHTFNSWGARTLIDGKRVAFNAVALQRKLRRGWHARRRPAAPAAGPGSVGETLTAAVPPAGAASRVFVVLPSLHTGGGEISMLRLAHGLALAGLAVDLVVLADHDRQLEVPPGVNLLSLDCRGSLGAVTRLAGAIRRHRPRWVISAFPHTNIASVAAVALARTGAGCIVTEHAPLAQQIAQQANWRYRVLPPLVHWAYRRADAVVAVSRGVAADLRALAGAEIAAEVIHNPVLAPDFEAEIGRLPDHVWLLDPALKVVLAVNRLSVEKDLPTVVRAFAVLHRARPETRLLIAGEGPDRGRIEALVVELGLQAVVALPGRTAQPLRWMHRAAVFVLGSRFEGFGNVLIEALACNTPVVSTDCPVGPAELLDGGRFGALVPVGDAAAMAAALAEALDRGEPPPGARDAARRYTQAHAAAAYLRLFDALEASQAALAAPRC